MKRNSRFFRTFTLTSSIFLMGLISLTQINSYADPSAPEVILNERIRLHVNRAHELQRKIIGFLKLYATETDLNQLSPKNLAAFATELLASESSNTQVRPQSINDHLYLVFGVNRKTLQAIFEKAEWLRENDHGKYVIVPMPDILHELSVMYQNSYFVDLDVINEFKNNLVEYKESLQLADQITSQLIDSSALGSLEPFQLDARLRIEKMKTWAKSIRIATLVVGQSPNNLYLGSIDQKKICAIHLSRDIQILRPVFRKPGLRGGEISPSYGHMTFIDPLTKDSPDRCIWVDDHEDWHAVIRNRYQANQFSWLRLPLILLSPTGSDAGARVRVDPVPFFKIEKTVRFPTLFLKGTPVIEQENTHQLIFSPLKSNYQEEQLF